MTQLIDFSQIYSTNIMSYDYRGYGESRNSAEINEASLYQDIEMIVAIATNRFGYKLENIILWGFSLGSGPTIDFASKYSQIGALILEAPLASVYVFLDSEANSDYQDAEGDIFGNIYKIQNVQCPMMMIHGNLSARELDEGQRLDARERRPCVRRASSWFFQTARLLRVTQLGTYPIGLLFSLAFISSDASPRP